ncbi:hypothetical protein C8R45DRAFT_1026416 [Mycena sanguinolenta]|nr:hypothetical protein C8R45DRAFT_1026416 [Mycena sanguinolenta]
MRRSLSLALCPRRRHYFSPDAQECPQGQGNPMSGLVPMNAFKARSQLPALELLHQGQQPDLRPDRLQGSAKTSTTASDASTTHPPTSREHRQHDPCRHLHRPVARPPSTPNWRKSTRSTTITSPGASNSDSTTSGTAAKATGTGHHENNWQRERERGAGHERAVLVAFGTVANCQ